MFRMERGFKKSYANELGYGHCKALRFAMQPLPPTNPEPSERDLLDVFIFDLTFGVDRRPQQNVAPIGRSGHGSATRLRY